MNQSFANNEYLEIKNWNKFQSANTFKWVKDYTNREDDQAFSGLTLFQRAMLEGLCRLRARTAKLIPHDAMYISRALQILPEERHCCAQAIRALIVSGFLIPSPVQDPGLTGAYDDRNGCVKSPSHDRKGGVNPPRMICAPSNEQLDFQENDRVEESRVEESRKEEKVVVGENSRSPKPLEPKPTAKDSFDRAAFFQNIRWIWRGGESTYHALPDHEERAIELAKKHGIDTFMNALQYWLDYDEEDQTKTKDGRLIHPLQKFLSQIDDYIAIARMQEAERYKYARLRADHEIGKKLSASGQGATQ